jgi:hypothetical protein
VDFGINIYWFMHFEDVFQCFENGCLLLFIFFVYSSVFFMKMGEERECVCVRERERHERILGRERERDAGTGPAKRRRRE